MRIVVTHMSSDRNKGDLAILTATVGALRQARPGARITLVSAELPSGAVPPAETRFSAELGAAILGTPVPSLRRHGRRAGSWLLRLARAELSLLTVRLLGRRGLGLVPRRDWPFFQELLAAELVVAKGGSYLYSRGGLSEVLYVWRMLYPLRAALAARRPPVLLGVSLGPFRPRFTRLLARRVLRQCRMVYVREELSGETASSVLGLAQVRSVPDFALLLESPAGPALGVWTIGFTVRDYSFPEAAAPAESRRAYTAALVKAVDELLAEDPQVRIVFVPQVLDDIAVARELHASFRQPARVEVLKGDLPIEQLLRVYAGIEVMVATRLHSAILAAVAGTPVVHLVYDRQKGLGVMARLGLEEWTLPADALDGQTLAAAIRRLRGERERVVAHLAQRVPELRAELRTALAELVSVER
jgi:polysaccharide pyruvyl transferase WcaK-like protein